jgi:hypothetical protein
MRIRPTICAANATQNAQPWSTTSVLSRVFVFRLNITV